MSKTFKDRKLSPEEMRLCASEGGRAKESKSKRSRLREIEDTEWEEELKWLKA